MNDRKKPLVVCVEDDKTCSLFLEKVLTQGGYDVSTSDTGEGGLRLARELRPDLILLDVGLPDMDGFQVCAKLQEDPDLSNIPVIFQTSTEVERARVLACGGVGFLLKPLSADDICDKVRQFSTRRSTWEKLRRTEGGRSLSLERPDFARFKEALFGDLHVAPDKAAQLGRVSAAAAYTLAKPLGISTSDLAKRIAEFLKFGYVSGINPEHVQLGILPASYCRMNQVVAVDDGKTSSFVLSNPFDWLLLTSLFDLKTQKEERGLLVTEPETILALFGSRKAVGPTDHGDDGPTLPDILAQLAKRYQAEPTALAQDAQDLEPIILLVNKLIESGQAMGASDIHIEPWEDSVVVRYRVDGDLRIVNRLYPQSLIRPIASRIKVMASLDISERRLPQDGRIVFKDFSRLDVDFDLRVATAPMNFGEKVVMRIVDKEKSILTLPELGFSPRHLALYRQVIDTPYGMILHVGPTGSGKSMTLYAALAELQSPELNIQTAEDPIEYTLAGINQMQMRADVGLTFQRALRCYLRQDPDIILIGEIRDRETAEIAVEASLTGHLLLSTLHTNDAPATITRFIQIGVEPFMVSSSLVLICAQRLLRRLCTHCKEAYEPNANERKLAGMTAAAAGPLHRHKGCELCNGIGYARRIGVHEILVPDDAMRTAINQKGITAETLKRRAVESCGMTTLYWDAMEKVRQGTTSLAEVISKVRQDEFDARPKWMLDGASE